MQTLVTCSTCTCRHGACAPSIIGASKYSTDLACVQADQNLAKITASHFGVLITQNANESMPNMIPIEYLNENFMYFNENSEGGGVNEKMQTKGQRVVKLHF